MRVQLYTILTAITVAKPGVADDNWLEQMRNVDLNDYALGVAVTTRQNPFVGGANGTILYPYLTSLTHSSMTDDWLLIRDGGYGIRWITDNEWELGVIGRVRTLGLGNSQAEDLVGIADRNWTIELGPTIGYRGWPVHINWTLWNEITGRHNGFVNDLALKYPIGFEKGFLVPSIHAIYESTKHSNYYYSVSEAESTPERPAYYPGSSLNARADVRLGYTLTPKWLLSATIGLEWLGSEITDSPIVGRERVWYGTLGLAYNADIFNPRTLDQYERRLPNVDVRVGAFFSSISTKLTRDTADGVAGVEIDLEKVLGTSNSEDTIEAEAVWRIGDHHQLELGFFQLGRSHSTLLTDELVFGDRAFAAGNELTTKIDYSSLRLGYTFYLMRDTQKELGVMGGVHLTRFAATLVEDANRQIGKSQSSTPLPVIGLNGALFFGDRMSLRGRVHVFRTDFDRHEGLLNYAALDLERRFHDSITLGIGYNYYGTKLSSPDSDLNGHLDIRHYGPVLFATFGF